jgi:phosphoglycerol transferase MdoB-like AlkP superfamily enzyme
MKQKLSLKTYINSQLRPLIMRLAMLVALYSFFRISFYFANIGNFPHASLSHFFYGIKFDLSAIFYSNLPYIVAVTLPFAFCYTRIYRTVFNCWFVIINSFAALVSYVDVAYYPYVLKRTTADFFSYLQIGFDFKTLIPIFLKQYWWLVLIFLATIFAMIYMVRLTNKRVAKYSVCHIFSCKELGYRFFLFFFTLFISLICMRGGFQPHPLGLIDSGKYASIQNAALISNTPFSLIKSTGDQRNKIEKHYFQDLEEAESFFSPIIPHITPSSQFCYPVKNVIIIILESFSQYLLPNSESDEKKNDYEGYCPFLNRLLKQSVSFNGFAASHRTIDGLPAIFGGLPKLLNKSYVETSFANCYTYSPVEVLKSYGFHTLFFHGAKNGSMNIESYCYAIGFDAYYGKNQYHNSFVDEGVWGISDRAFLKYVAKTLPTVPQPFFASVLTLSSHHPYDIPKDASDLDIKTGIHPMLAVVSYTDHAIREFFETLSHYSWYDSTLFVITSDHTGIGSIPISPNMVTTMQIPIFFYHPLANNNNKLGAMQQTDIMPSLFSLLQIDEPLFSYGNNIFDSTYSTCSANYLWESYQLITEDFILQFDGEKSTGFFNIKKDFEMQNNLINQLPNEVALHEQKLKAIIQSYTTRLQQNNLFIR